MGTDALFENHTIKEIQEIEKKLRNDIERKKEELRQMVGERYRDLMEAADTITEMKEIAESVTGCVKSVEQGCTKLQNSNLQNGILFAIQEDVAKKKQTNELLYIIASQIKILMDSPTKIWFSIENKDFASALSLYLLARHTHSLLLLDPIYRDKNVSALFPIISRQWTSISHFKHVLLQNCESILKIQSTKPEDVLGLLCCNYFLSNTSIQDVFLNILEVRKNVLNSIFHPQKSAKAQICEFVMVVQMTLQMVYVLLYPGKQSILNDGYKTNLLYEKLTEMISKERPGPVSLLDLNSTATYKFLPVIITEFRPSSTTALEACTSEFLKDKCKEWLNDIKKTVPAELKNLLNFVTSVQSLALIREAVFEKVCEIEHWHQICDDLLEEPFSIWDSFLKESIWERIKNIINDQVLSASEFCQKDTEETLYKVGINVQKSELEAERNISLYVWFESPKDVMENIAWHPRHHRTYWNTGELSMKAMGFTPKVQQICKDLDYRLQNVLEDISHFSYLQSQLLESSDNKFLSSLTQKHAQELSKDGNHVYTLLSQAVEKHLFDLSNYIETTLLYLDKEEDCSEKSYRIVLLGHLCFGLSHLCPHINCTLSEDKLGECVERCRRQGSKVAFPAVTMRETELWKDLRKKLLNLSSSAYRLWSKFEISNILKTVDSELTLGSAEGLLKFLLRWDKIEIQEESEQGNAVNSVLKIPQHVSTPVSNALFSFCRKLNAVGGYSISSEVRSSVSKELLSGLLLTYRRKADACDPNFHPRLLQVQSLQLLFDVQFLAGLLAHKSGEDAISANVQELVSLAVSRVDPFDMDVFSAPLQQNIKKALQKSLALFGLLTSPDQVSYLNSLKSQLPSGQMDHNVMLSCQPGGRFPLLPLSSKSSAVAVNALAEQFPNKTADARSSLPSHNSSPNLSAADASTNPMKSAASFYDRVSAMSSSWFGN